MSIKDLLKEKYGITRPIKEVNGGFYCYNKLTSLEGAPKEVNGNFDCSYNKLTSLEGAPKEVKGNFYCYDNETKFTRDKFREVCNIKGDVYV